MTRKVKFHTKFLQNKNQYSNQKRSLKHSDFLKKFFAALAAHTLHLMGQMNKEF